MPSYLDANGDPVPSESLQGKRVALYFSAGWCPMCTRLEPALQQFRQAAADSGKPVELVYVPSDRNEQDHMQRVSQLKTWTIPFDQADSYKKDFKIWSGSEAMKLGMGRRSGVPALVVLDNKDAKKELAFLPAESKGAKALEDWPLDDGIWGEE